MAEISAIEKHACPACGAQAEWNPARQMLVCPFCGTQSPYKLEPDKSKAAQGKIKRGAIVPRLPARLGFQAGTTPPVL